MYEKILVAIDETPEHKDVLEHTAAIAKAFGSTVHVLHVQTIDTTMLGGGVIEEDKESVRTLVREAVKGLADQGVQAEGELREATRPDIARTILAAAKEEQVGLVIVGARRRHGLSGLVLGSVADGIAHGSPSFPVMLIPA